MNQSRNHCCNQSAQFLKKEATTDEVILKTERELNKELVAVNKRER